MRKDWFKNLGRNKEESLNRISNDKLVKEKKRILKETMDKREKKDKELRKKRKDRSQK